MKKLILTMMVAMISLTSFAQFGGGGQRREFKPEDQATRRADQIKEAAKISRRRASAHSLTAKKCRSNKRQQTLR